MHPSEGNHYNMSHLVAGLATDIAHTHYGQILADYLHRWYACLQLYTGNGHLLAQNVCVCVDVCLLLPATSGAHAGLLANWAPAN